MEQGNPVIQSPIKPNNFLITLLSVLLLISCFIAGFFAWQTQKLVKELTAYRLKPVATQTPIPTSTPQIYELFQNGIYSTINFPQECVLNKYLYTCVTSKFKLDIEPQAGGRGTSSQTTIKKIGVAWFEWERITWTENGKTMSTYNLNHNNNHYLFQVTYEPYSEEAQRYFEDRILSTFRFMEPEASSSPIACTEEAKICPDGSAVGRTGPNCAFAPCPTPKN